MKEQLFDLPESLSPKLAWLREHGLVTSYHAEWGGESPETGEEVFPWTCCQHHPPRGEIRPGLIGVGRTEEDAIVDYCRKNDLPHYSLKP